MRYLLILAFLSLSVPAHADIAADTEFVVMKQMETAGTAQRLDVLSDQAITNIEPGIEGFGARIIDRAAFKEELLDDAYDTLLHTIRDRWIAQYTAHLTPEEISALADFYRSGAGAALEATFAETGDGAPDAHELLDGPLRPLVEHFSQMQASFSDIEDQRMAEFSHLFALDRLNRVFAMEDIIAFDSEARRQEVKEAIEAYLIN